MNRPRHKDAPRAWGLLLLAVLAVGLLLGLPLWSLHSDGHAEIERLEQRLFQYQQLAARRDSLAAQHVALDEAELDSPWFVRSTDPALSSAQLQSRFREAISDSGSRLSSLQPLDESALEHGITRVALTARWKGSLAEVQRSLHAIQSAVPALNIEELTLAAATKRRQNAPLDVRAVISGYFREARP